METLQAGAVHTRLPRSDSGGWGEFMLRVDGAYIYELGAKLRPILSLKEEQAKRIEIYHIVGPAHDAINEFLYQSVFAQHARTAHASAKALLEALSSVKINLRDMQSVEEIVMPWDISGIQTKFRAFDAVLSAELQNYPLYLVFSKGGFDISCLTDAGLTLFPSSLSLKCPEATEDVLMGARCMAFELWTAMGFHFHRANEAVLRRYFDSVIGDARRPNILTMGTMVSTMEKANLGHADIRAALKNIISFHRNPIAHPDHSIPNDDEAISLYSAIRACMGYMLDTLPPVSLPALVRDENSAAAILANAQPKASS